MKSSAQILFERVIRTWIAPNIILRQKQASSIGPIPLRMALIVWEQSAPTILLNDEVFGNIRKLEIVSAGPIEKGQSVTSSDINGIGKVVLTAKLASYPYIVIVQGRNEKFYLSSQKMGRVVSSGDFEAFALALKTEGVVLSTKQHLSVYLDLTKNIYEVAQTPSDKRREYRTISKHFDTSKADIRAKVRRFLRLPTLIIHNEHEFLPLLLETRATYIDGHFFSCIVSAVTTADRICIRLMQRAGLPEARQILGMTFGQKIQPLRSKKLITKSQEILLIRLNKIRNRHVHPRTSPSALTAKRDALHTIKLLHELLEETFSVFRDYNIEKGIFVPKPLV